MSLRERMFRFVRGNIRVKVTLGIVLPLLVILGLFTAIEQNHHRQLIFENLASMASLSGKVVEANLHRSMLKSDFASVQSILDAINEHNDFSTIYLLNTDGKVIFSPNKAANGLQLNNREKDCMPCHRLPAEQRPSSVLIETGTGTRLFRSMYPIPNSPECAACHDPQERLIGLLLTDIPTGPMEANLAADLRSNLLFWLGTILVTIIIVNLALSGFVIRRLERFAHALGSFGQEHLDLRMQPGELDEIGQLAQTFNEMGQRIESEVERNQSLSQHLLEENEQRGLLLKRLINAQEDERKRVARDLHDDLGQSLSALQFQAKNMERLIPNGSQEALDQLNTTEDLISSTTDHMYDLILALRPSVLDELGLLAALRAHAERSLKEKGIAFEMKTEGFASRLPPAMETNLYRIFQEAMNNIRRHASARSVRLSLARHNGLVTAEIQDNGCGFDTASIRAGQDGARGLGLLSMQERAAICGGTLEIHSQPGEGTVIRVSIPVEEDCDQSHSRDHR